MESDPTTTRPADPDLVLPRYDRLRRAAPAVQHEVNNALMVVSSNLELLGRHVPDGSPRRQLDRALDAIRRLEVAVRGYLDAARRPPENIDTVSPEVALRQVLPLLRVVLGARYGFELEPSPPGIPELRMDRGRFDLALLALVHDATDRMAPGTTIQARFERQDGDVALRLSLPPGAAPQGETRDLLQESVTVTGGRLELTPGGASLIWRHA